MKFGPTLYDFPSTLAEVQRAVARWDVPFGPACDAIEMVYRKHLAIHVGNVVGVAVLHDPGRGEAQVCADLLANATGNVVEALLAAPAVAARCYWERDRYSHEESVNFLKNAIQLLSPGNSSTGWTSLGDVYFNGGKAEFNAPRIEGIVVDAASPNRMEGSGVGEWKDVPPESTEIQETAMHLISSAIELLDRHCSNASAFVRRELRVVVPRSSESAGSSSTLSYPGRAILDFPKRGLTVGEVAEALVHESVHTLLYKIEAFHHWIDDEPGWAKKIKSPWTGNEISLHAYSHACFVWYALAGLWLSLEGVDEKWLGVQPKFRMWSAVKGFLKNATKPLEHEDALSAEVMESCIALQSDIVNWYT